MTTQEPSLGMIGIEAVHFFVRHLRPWRDFFTTKLELAHEVASTGLYLASPDDTSYVFPLEGASLVLTQASRASSKIAQFTQVHPDGVGEIVIAVKDADATAAVLEARGATLINDVSACATPHNSARSFAITTPLGDTLFRFVERHTIPDASRRRIPHPLGIGGIDHVTSNFLTLAPAILWFEHVMGLRRYWQVDFHTSDVAPQAVYGSGLRSVVVWDPESGIKFANNEPARPFFDASQIYVFAREHRGPGVQHIALGVDNLIKTVGILRQRNVNFMPTPNTYYELLPERLRRLGIAQIDEPLDELAKLGILVDGEGDSKYMLQIFLQEQATLLGDGQSGPFFLELISRRGDRGFGAGNFRALFESIELAQKKEGKRL